MEEYATFPLSAVAARPYILSLTVAGQWRIYTAFPYISGALVIVVKYQTDKVEYSRGRIYPRSYFPPDDPGNGIHSELPTESQGQNRERRNSNANWPGFCPMRTT